MIQTTPTITKQYNEVRSRTEKLCKPLKEEDTVVQPIVDVSPPKWHLGHTTWFFENFLLVENLPNYQLYNKKLNYIFNSYYESQGERILRANRGNLTRPTLQEVLAYRAYVNKYMLVLLEKAEGNQTLLEWIELGLQHEMQHQELLVTDIKYILGNNPLFPVYNETLHKTASSNLDIPTKMLGVTSGVYEIGFKGNGFHFDNEQGRHKVYLEDFEISNKLVTNREYLSFIEDGGYNHYSFWLSEGWEWVKGQETKAPLYWFFSENKWWQFTLHGLQELNLDEPVMHISYYEAEAYARWKGLRLPTEFEWEIACNIYGGSMSESSNLLEKELYHASIQQENDFIGNLWEWTSSAYLPYPYYKQAAGALGEYNGKFMINQMVLRGGSSATPTSQIRPSYRNFFQTDKQWQFTGIRLANHL